MKLDNSLKILSDMIAIPSVNPMGLGHTGDIYTEKHLVDYLANRLRKIGCDIEIDQSDPEHPCIIGYLDNGAKETILLDSHLDTVSHLEMVIDPFDPLIKNDLMYGRGSCDTKASMATYIDAIESINRRGERFTKNILIVGCSDEEFSFSGMAKLKKKGLKADYAIIGEPTELNGLSTHKGVLRCYIRAEGVSCHSSTPELGANAIYRICEAVKKLELYHHSLASKTHPLLGAATLSVGIIKGGTTVNTVPSSAYIDVDRRLIPGENPEEVFNDIKKALKDCEGISLDSPYVKSSGYDQAHDTPIAKQLKHCCSRHQTNMKFTSASFATHGSFYETMSIPSIVFGPGSISKAHTKDEFVEIDQVLKASSIIQTLLTTEHQI